MKIIGLTGSIATGKSFVGRCFAKLGVPVFDADAVVHQLLDVGGKAVRPVSQRFPETYKQGAIDRKELGSRVFLNKEELQQLESIIHPLVHAEEELFLAKARKAKHKLVVLEVPLLFEKGSNNKCDHIVVTIVNEATQRERAMARQGMTEEKLQRIRAQQHADEEKQKKADFVIDTINSEFAVFRQVKQIIKDILSDA